MTSANDINSLTLCCIHCVTSLTEADKYFLQRLKHAHDLIRFALIYYPYKRKTKVFVLLDSATPCWHLSNIFRVTWQKIVYSLGLSILGFNYSLVWLKRYEVRLYVEALFLTYFLNVKCIGSLAGMVKLSLNAHVTSMNMMKAPFTPVPPCTAKPQVLNSTPPVLWEVHTKLVWI